jgi:hypothetical protein
VSTKNWKPCMKKYQTSSNKTRWYMGPTGFNIWTCCAAFSTPSRVHVYEENQEFAGELWKQGS